MVTLNGLWTPEGVEHLTPLRGGQSTETGEHIVHHTFRFKDKASGRGIKVIIPADSTMSNAYIEDLAAKAFENWLEEIRIDGKKRAPTVKERKNIGRAINEWRKDMIKRKMSPTSKLYY